MGWGWGWGGINIHIDISMSIDIHIIINMNIEDYMSYYLISIIYSPLAIPYWLFPCGPRGEAIGWGYKLGFFIIFWTIF